MFTSVWRYLCFSCLAVVSSASAEFDGLSDECGRVLVGPRNWDAIYIFCPALPQMNAEQAHSLVMAVLDSTTRISGHTRIFFFGDESVLDRDRWPADQGRLIESWGNALVGAYHTETQVLAFRSTTNAEWRNLYLPTARQ